MRNQQWIGERERAGLVGDAGAQGPELKQVRQALHDLCQPLTALQCRLEIGQMTGTLQGYEEAVAEGLQECNRMVRTVAAMRELVAGQMQRG